LIKSYCFSESNLWLIFLRTESLYSSMSTEFS
jgi:hypothetical protein